MSHALPFLIHKSDGRLSVSKTKLVNWHALMLLLRYFYLVNYIPANCSANLKTIHPSRIEHKMFTKPPVSSGFRSAIFFSKKIWIKQYLLGKWIKVVRVFPRLSEIVLAYACSHYVLLSLEFAPDFSFLMKYYYNSYTKIILNKLCRPLDCKSRCCHILVWWCEMPVQWKSFIFNIWVNLKNGQW